MNDERGQTTKSIKRMNTIKRMIAFKRMKTIKRMIAFKRMLSI
jgi:hypothetical protein